MLIGGVAVIAHGVRRLTDDVDATVRGRSRAKTTLSQLVAEVEAGGEVLLARGGKPVAKLVPIRVTKRRKLGQWKGKVRMSQDFDAPLPPDMQAAWEGS
jgi:prevent-host-death family protein